MTKNTNNNHVIIKDLTNILELDIESKGYYLQVCEIVSRNLGADTGKLLFVDHSQTHLCLKTAFPEKYSTTLKEAGSIYNKIPIGSFRTQESWDRGVRSISGHVFYTQKPIIIESFDAKEKRIEDGHNIYEFNLSSSEKVGSEIIAPLSAQGKKLGVICLSSVYEKTFSEKESDKYTTYIGFLSTLLELRRTRMRANGHQQFVRQMNRYQQDLSKSFHFDDSSDLLKSAFKASKVAVGFFSIDYEWTVNVGESDFKKKTKKDLISKVSDDAFLCSVISSVISSDGKNVSHTNRNCFTDADGKRFLLFFSGRQWDFDKYPKKPFGYLDIRYEERISNIDLWLECNQEKMNIVFNHYIKAIQGKRLSYLDKANKILADLSASDLTGTHSAKKAIENLISSFGYSNVHVWIKKYGYFVLKYPSNIETKTNYLGELHRDGEFKDGYFMKPARFPINTDCYVSRCFDSAKSMLTYDLNKVLYDELVPKGNVSWMGVPLRGVDSTFGIEKKESVVGILSCFDPLKRGNDEKERLVVLTQLDLTVLEYICSAVAVLMEIEKTLTEQSVISGFRAHEVMTVFSSIRKNFELLNYWGELGYKAFIKQTKGNVESRRRPPQVLSNNIESFMDFLIVMLNRSRYLNEDWQTKITSVRLLSIVASTTAVFRTFLEEKKSKKTVMVEYEMFDQEIIDMDKHAVQEILLNLLMNAAKYCDDNSTVYIRHPRKGVLHVVNQGIGIPKKETEMIFNRCFRASNARKDEYREFHDPGAVFVNEGYGLYFCKTICDKLGFDIKVVNPDPNCTTFELDLNVKEWIYETSLSVR